MATSYPNPYGYTSPIGQAFGNLAKVLMSGPSQAERIKGAEEALKLKRTRENTDTIADLFNSFGGDGFDRNAAMAAAVRAGYDPSDLATLERYGAANTFGATDPRTANAQVGAGGAYSSTAPAFFTDQANTNARHSQTLAQDLLKFNSTPKEALINGVPSFVPQSDLTGEGIAPIMSDDEQKGTLLGNNWSNLSALAPEQKRVLGALPNDGTSRTPRNYVAPDGSTTITYDGVTSAQTGAPLVPGGYIASAQGSASDVGLTTGAKTGLQGDKVANDTLSAVIDLARGKVQAAPDTMFGVSGNVQSLSQDAAAIATNVANGLGFEAPQQALASIQAEMAQSGVSPSIISGIFDPRLGELQAVYGMLVYATARALSGSGQLSNQDVEAARNTIGDPLSFRANKQSMLSKLDAVQQLLATKQSVIDQNLGGAPAPGAPSASEGAKVERWIRGPDGTMQRGQ